MVSDRTRRLNRPGIAGDPPPPLKETAPWLVLADGTPPGVSLLGENREHDQEWIRSRIGRALQRSSDVDVVRKARGFYPASADTSKKGLTQLSAKTG